MNAPSQAALNLFEEFASQLAAVFETMAGTRPAVSCEEAGEAPLARPGSLGWVQPLEPLQGSVYVVAQQEHWTTIGQRLLSAVGIDDAAAEDIQSTYREAIGQALSGLASHLTGVFGREISCTGGTAIGAEQELPSALWSSMRIGAGTNPMAIQFGVDPSLIELLDAANDATEESGPPSHEPYLRDLPAGDQDARTFDLLLDVELPVSVSFGRAHLPLKDVLKLTTGSIVELNRAVVEPVDIIVNNCVIARGEVVVVEGNFGVRIQQVVSRSERLRTIQ